MANEKNQSYNTKMVCAIDVSDETRYEVSVLEASLTESLLTPGLQTSVIVQSKLYEDGYVRNLNDFYAKDMTIYGEGSNQTF